MKHLKLFFALFAMLALNVGNAWAETVTYTVTSKSAVSSSGTAPEGSSATYSSTYNTKCQLTSGNSMTLTLSGFDGCTITGLTLSMKSNSSKGKGSMSMTVGSTSIASIADSKFNTANWAGKWSTSYLDIKPAVTATTVASGEKIVIKIAATENSLYCQSFTLTYDAPSSGGSEEPGLSVEPKEVAFGTKNIYFESDKQGSLEIDITGQNLTGDVTAEISGADASVFTLSKTTFTPNSGEVSEKLTVSYSVSDVKDYAATLTLSSDGVDNVELPITLKTVNKKPTIYTKVTDAATLSAGDKVIFVYETGKVAAGAISNTSGGYLASIDITQALNTTANPATASITDEAVVEYTLGGTTGAWEFISTQGKLSEKTANSTGSVDLKANGDTKWIISISSGNATIIGTTNTIKYNTSNPRFKTYSSGQTAIQLYAISVPKYAVNFTQPEGGELIIKNGETAITSGNTFAEGIKLTVTATPANGYEGGTIVVKDGSDNDITSTVYADGVLTMPAYNVTISAAFEQKQCTILGTPSVSASTTYNTATLSWETVANAAKYSVKVGAADAFETTETSYKATDLEAETIYTYQVKAIAADDQSEYCDSEAAEGSFTTSAAPVVTLTLKDIAGTTTKTGALNSTITLPDEAATCTKTFVGWDVDENCDHAPTYAPGAEYTLAAETQTLYAVYADAVGGEPTWNRVTNLAALTSGGTFILGYEATPKSGKIIPMRTSGTATTSAAGYMYSGNADGTTSNNATLDMASISESSKFEIVLEASSIVDGAVNIKLGDNYLGNTNTKNNCKLFTSASKNTAFTPTIGTNDVVKLTIKANNDYTTLQFNNNSGSYRYAVYGGAQKDVVFYKKEITLSYSNYSTTCAAAPIATVTPETVTANAAGAEGKVTVTYENVNTANVAVALYNDDACTEAFAASWLTAALDGDKNIAYTVAATTLYTERKAYIKLTAPETTGATDPDVVVIPVTQAAKDKVFASLEELVAADLTAGDEVTVTLNNDVIKEFYIYSSKRCGVVFDVQKDGKDIKIYFNSQTTIDDWAVGGKLSGTLTNVKWTTYSSAWQLAPANTWAWANLTYTEPKAVSTVVVSGAPTKTTYVDGEAFDPAGLTVTVNYNDATSEENPTGVTFNVTPTTLVKGQTSVSVTATFNSVTSAAYEVTGLTVNDIPNKTVAEFIAAGGTRCYLEGIVSNITNTTYGNFDLTDASGKIYVYGCLNAAGEKQKFAELGVKNGDKIKVIADQFKVYSGKNQATDVQYVSHISAASITVENITMEVDEVATITASVDRADAVVTYTIKENAENAISLSGNTITALAEGTATITATVAEGATYLGNSVDFTVTVGPKTEKVVILAQYEGQWYAMKAQYVTGKTSHLVAHPVTYFDGKLYNVNEADKALIEWERAVVDGKATFSNNSKYLTGKSDKTDLTLAATACEWTVSGDSYLIGSRTFLYNAENNWFRNFGTSNAGDKNYSNMPVVTAPVYTTGDVTYTRATTAGKFGTICLPFGSTNYTGAEFFEFVGSETGKVYIGSVDELVAGVPYIFLASAAKVVVTSDGTTAATPGDSNGLYGTFTDNTEVAVGNYILKDNALCQAEAICWVNAYRAYIVMSEVPTGVPQQMPGRRYIGMSVQGENEATGFENITAPEGQVIKAIVNGQLVIIRGGEMYNVQGQKL